MDRILCHFGHYAEMIGNSLLNTVSGAVLINLLLTGSTMSLNSEWIVPFFFFFFSPAPSSG